MKKCDECGKRAEGLGTYPTQFQDIILCSECYERIPALRIAKKKKFTRLDELSKIQQQAQEQMKQQQYTEDVRKGIEQYFQVQQEEVRKQE